MRILRCLVLSWKRVYSKTSAAPKRIVSSLNKILEQRSRQRLNIMALVSGRRSTLNPNAPLFIPAAFRKVEDFSPEWWQLVTTSTWYRDYWIDQHQGQDGFYDNGENDSDSLDVADLLPESFDFDAGEDLFYTDIEFDAQIGSQSLLPPFNGDREEDVELPSFLTSLEERSPKPLSEPAKYLEKPAKWVNPRHSPRNIHQPR